MITINPVNKENSNKDNKFNPKRKSSIKDSNDFRQKYILKDNIKKGHIH